MSELPLLLADAISLELRLEVSSEPEAPEVLVEPLPVEPKLPELELLAGSLLATLLPERDASEALLPEVESLLLEEVPLFEAVLPAEPYVELGLVPAVSVPAEVPEELVEP